MMTNEAVKMTTSELAEEEEDEQGVVVQGNFLLIYICNFHVLSHLLLIYICKLLWNFLTDGFIFGTVSIIPMDSEKPIGSKINPHPPPEI